MPYMLISRGCRSPNTSNQGSRLLTSSASPPNTTCRKARPCPCRAAAQATGINWRNADGVWFSTVTCSRCSSAWKSSVERATSLATITARPPYNSAPNSSHTEKSKA
ncbi:hypothetical protein D3C75_514580 [compost metagenome]